MFSVAGLRTLQAQPYSPDFPMPFGTSVILGFRTCLPLRGSSGFSPDSLLILLAEKPWRKTTISCVSVLRKSIRRGFLAEAYNSPLE
jgi:hypothetical protein